MTEPIELRLKPEDGPDTGVRDDYGAPVWEGEVSALVEAQCLEVVGKLGAIRTILLRSLADPNRRTNTPESKAIRTALTLANEGVTIMQAITMSTVRRGR